MPEDLPVKTINWTSLDSTIANVNHGVITAVGVGETYIKSIYAEDQTVSDSCKVMVINPIEVSLDQTTVNLNLDTETSVQLTATVSPANATEKNIIWSSSVEHVATVDQNGLVTALSEGIAKIKAQHTIYPNIFEECTIIVLNTVTGLSLSADTLYLEIGTKETETLKAYTIPSGSETESVSWRSTNTGIADVDDSGVVTALKEGKTNVVATYTEDTEMMARCVIIVSEPTSITSAKHQSLKVYPNPTFDQLNITDLQETCSYRITDINGKYVQSGKIENNTIDVDALKGGFYIVTMQFKENTFSVPFLKN